MTTDQTYPEPPNQSVVAWFDARGSLIAVFSRDDQAAWESGYADDDPANRWYKMGDEVADFGPMTWRSACREERGWQGPFLLKPEPLLAAEAVTSRA